MSDSASARRDRIADPQPRYSVLLASRNEGERLRKTVDDVLRHVPDSAMEVVIVDDASDDDSAAFAASPEYSGLPIRVVRNESHRGLIFSRARAADLARGEHLAFLDAHCAVTPGWLDTLAEKLATIERRGLVAPALYRLRPDWSIDIDSTAAAACTVSSPFLDFAWTRPTEIDGRSCTCTIGGGAWMCHADWYRHIGGLDRGMVTWGLENIDLPLRTWTSGGWCLVAEDVAIGHLYNELPTYVLGDADFVYNKLRAVHNVFQAETFTRVAESLVHLGGFGEALERLHAEREELAPFKDHVESIRQRSDSWLIDTFRLPLLESPFYHRARRRPVPGGNAHVPRPTVAVIVPIGGERESMDSLLSTIFERSRYGNFDVVFALDPAAGDADLAPEGTWKDHPRVRVERVPVGPGGGAAADFLAFLPADTIDVDEHWIEELLLVAERRPRLLMVAPRTRWRADDDTETPLDDSFERLWDWDAPGFLRERTGEPLSEGPYHALSCDDGPFLVRREALDDLGGFDATVPAEPSGLPRVTDLAIRGWLAGYEVFCHPGVAVTRRCGTHGPERGASTSADSPAEYAAVLPAVTCFSSSRLERCRKRCPGAEPLLRRHAEHIERRRGELLERAWFDDDWLFFKFDSEAWK